MLHFSVCLVEMTLSTYRDIKDFVSKSHGTKFRTAKNV
jgi:hypothetical protein